MPANAKQPDARQGHRAGLPAEIPNNPAGLVVPRVPPGVPVRIRAQWQAIWTSPVARLLDPVTDAPAVARLLELRALLEHVGKMTAHDVRVEARERRAMIKARKDGDPEELALAAESLVTARRALNATVPHQTRIAAEIRMIEGQLGISPRARLALGVMLLNAGRAAGGAGPDPDDDDDDVLDGDFT